MNQRTWRFPVLCASVFIALAACGPAPPPAAPEAQAPATFVNRIWQVQSSSAVAPGTLYAFLSEGTLLITSPHSRPALGSWKVEGGALTLVEEGLAYSADVLELSAQRFSIRVRNPGEPTLITFVPAAAPAGVAAPSQID